MSILNAKVAVINCSKPYYNLGARKLTDWLRSEGTNVTYYDGDPGWFVKDYGLVALSVIFSWHAPIAQQIAIRAKENAEVWCGGPGMYALKNWWERTTGVNCHVGLSEMFERQRGNYKMTFASRGCPVGCWFCIVPKIEGKTFTLDYDFQPAPILCDNNLSALPVDFQNHIINRYQETGTRLLDANSGFEPRTFDEGCYRRWKPILKGPWRFAFDEMNEREYVEQMMKILKDERPDRKRVYVLIGNEPIEQCYERVRLVIDWGGEPHCQAVMPLNALKPDQYKILHDWNSQKLKDFARWANRWLWRTVPLSEYRPRKTALPSFARL